MPRLLLTWIGLGRLVGLSLLAALLVVRVADPSPVAAMRNFSFDLFQQLKPREVAPLPVVIIDIDDASIAELGQWPWPRTIFADLVTKATEGGAVALAFDVIFAEPDRLSPARVAANNPNLPPSVRSELAQLEDNDDALARAMSQARVIVGQTSIRSGAGSLPVPTEVRQVPHAFLGPDPTPYLQRFPDLVQNLPEIEAEAAGRGVFTVRPDADGIYRRVPLVMQVQGAIRLGLAPELLRVATGGQAFAVRSNAAGIDGIVVGGQFVQTAADGSVWPHFSPHAPSRFVSAADLISGRMQQDRLAGHLVLVGTSAIGLEDFRPTPLGIPMAGVEIHAQVLENILSGTLLSRPNYAIGAELATLAVLGLAVIALVPIIAARWVVLLSLTILAGWGALTWGLFETRNILLDSTWPLLGTAAIIMVMSTANYLREERQREAIRTAFGQYVSPDLVSRLADDPQSLVLGGERREITVLFSDVRGFTTLAESYRDDPRGLTTLMNRFLTALSQAILDSRGTIDKFMGDAVMAFWNAPLDVTDHARAGCMSALQMQANIEALNARRADEAAAEGKTAHPIDVGVGLNTGTCVVGIMGSESRFDYTALGDAVNLASRLEGQCKTYGVRIVLGASTAAAVPDLALIEIDLIRVTGKTEPERIFALLGDAAMGASPLFRALVDANTRMRRAYSGQDWVKILPALSEISDVATELELDLDGYIALYRERTETFQAAPPLPGWDGVYTAEIK